MSHEKTTLEIIAPTVEEAVEKGVAQLGIPADSLEVEVLDEGSKGFLGIGSRQARVRLSIKMEVPAVRETPARPAAAPAAPAVPAAPAAPMAEKGQAIAVETAGEEPEKDEAMTVAKQVVSDLISRMKVNAQVQARYLKPEDEKDESVLLVDIRGQDLSILIGRRSETLNALQYIANLIVGKQLGYWVPLMIDVQGYRFRRERQLRKLARRMADQAVQTNRRQVLEPMPANERRLIHLELRDHPNVVTQSTGEEPYRKVTIQVKR